MLKTIDRIQIATDDADATAALWADVLGAERESEQRVGALGARRVSSRLGRGYIEFLEPDGAGVIAEALRERKRPHLFAGGISTPDFDACVRHVESKGVDVAVENGQAFLNPAEFVGVPCPLVLSPYEERPSVGAIDFLYEVTLLADDAPTIVSRIADLFGLDATHFKEIASERFAYSGVLTLFDPDDLHRFEVITPTSNELTMGRFFEKAGPSYYMCFAETSNLLGIERQCAAANLGITIDRPQGRAPDQPPDQAWIHPPTLGGVMLGLSRPTMAWHWSGHPERVEDVA